MPIDPFYEKWGIEPPKPQTGLKVRTLEPKEFDKWLQDPPPAPPVYDTNNWTSTVNAATGAATEGVPIAGPYLYSGMTKLAARIRSLQNKTPYEQELRTVAEYNKQSREAHPIASITGGLGGAIGPMLALGALPAGAQALGMTGPLGQRVLAGLTTNAAISGADTAVRTGGHPYETLKGTSIGGIVGGAAPLVGPAASASINYLTRPASDPNTLRLLALAGRQGIPIGAAQVSTSPFVQKVSQMAGQLPGSGDYAFRTGQSGAFTRAVSQTFGENTANLTQPTMLAAQRRIGNTMNTIQGRTTMTADLPLHQQFMTIARGAQGVLGEDALRPVAHQMNQIAERFATNGRLTGEQYKAITGHGSDLSRLQQSENANVRHFANQIRGALDDLLERHATPRDVRDYREARRQYKNMMVVAPLVVKGTPGEISPLLLNARVNAEFPNRAFRHAGELDDLAELGQRFFKQPRDSGTPMGALIADQFMRHGNALAVGALGAATGGGFIAGYEPTDILKGVGGLAAAGLLGRGTTAILNRPQSVNELIRLAPYASPYATGVVRNQTQQPVEPAPPQ